MGRFGLRTARLWATSIAAVLCISTLCHPAFAQKEKRLALVIGQSGYQHVQKLTNPINDASAIADRFKAAGFEVDLRRDLSNIEMRRAIRDFTIASRGAEIAVVYFAGHSFEVSGTNYLIPVDARLQNDLDVEDEALSLDRVMKALDSTKRLRLIILDACRDNPFLKTMTRTVATRQVTNGLAKVEPDTDTLIAFAAKAGSTADDGAENHSPFTVALLNNLFDPGTDIRIALGRVRDEVKRSTGNRQEPFVYGSLGGNTVSLVPAPAARPSVSAPSNDPQANVRRDYEFAERVGTREAWDSFLSLHPAGFFADLAKAARSKIIAGEQRARAEAAERAGAANAAAERAKAEAARLAAEAAETARVEATRLQDQARRAEAEKRIQIAALPANTNDPEVTRSLQTELRRVGCHLGAVDGKWNPASQRSIESFNRYSGLKLDTAAASVEALDGVKGQRGRICPLICGANQHVEGDRCVANPVERKPPPRKEASRPPEPSARDRARERARERAAERPRRERQEVQREAPRRATDIPCDRGFGGKTDLANGC